MRSRETYVRRAPRALGGESSPPDGVDHLGRRHGAALAQQQHPENGTLQRSAQIEFVAITPRAHGTEHGEPKAAFDALTSHAVCLQGNGTICYQIIERTLPNT
ncbi:hypothetical protein GCM10010486_09420 [Nonomuraea roseoviolacea subsp. carminata]